MDYLLLSLAFLLILVGIVGCLIPVIPGPPISYAGIIVLQITPFAEFSKNLLIILAIVAGIVTVLDFLVPIWGTKKFGGSKYGVRGATIGLIVGLFFGPVGIILGPFLGAYIGEMIKKNDFKYAIKASVGSLLGFITGVGLKLAASFTITFYFIRAFFQ